MITPNDVAGMVNRRPYREMPASTRWADYIRTRSYAVDDHVIWLSGFDQGNRVCWFEDKWAGSIVVDVKRFVTRTKVPNGFRPLWRSTCGHNRCIRPEHIELVKLVPTG